MPPSDGAHAFAVVVEQLRGDFKVFGEALGGLRQQVTEEIGGLRGEIGGLRQQMTDGFERVDRELGEVRRDLGEVKRDLCEVKRDLGEVKVDLGLVKSAVTTHTRELREIRGTLGNKVERGEVEAIVEHAVARVAGR
jgi:archaellum component FlaC